MFQRIVFCEVLNYLRPKKVCNTRGFRNSTAYREKYYEPPMVIKKRQNSLQENRTGESLRSLQPRPEDRHPERMIEGECISLEKYLIYAHSRKGRSFGQKLFSLLSTGNTGSSYHPKLRVDENGYLLNPLPGYFKSINDVVIIGGGLVGYSIAHHVNRIFRGDIKVTIIENDKKPELATHYPFGHIGQQFDFEELQILSTYAIEFLDIAKEELSIESFIPEIDINYGGVLNLKGEKADPEINKSVITQRLLGYSNEMLNNAALHDRFPWMKVDDLEGAVMGSRQEGWFNNDELLSALKLNSEYYGNILVRGEITDSFEDGDVKSGSLLLSRIRTLQVQLSDGEEKEINCGTVVLAAGTSCPRISKMFEVGTSDDFMSPYFQDLPIEKMEQYFTTFTAKNGPGLNCPIIRDPSGITFRRQGLEGMYICLWENDSAKNKLSEQVEIEEYFKSSIFPKLVNRVPVFKNSSILKSTECSYEQNTYDKRPIIGFHPAVTNLFLACGFNQDGFHALGTGKYLTDILLDRDPKIDLARLNMRRLKNKIISE